MELIINGDQMFIRESSEGEYMHYTQKQLQDLELKAKTGGLLTAEILNLIATTRDLVRTVNDWYGFLTEMSKHSSWRNRIQEKLDLYDFGTTDKDVVEAVRQYLARKAQRESFTEENKETTTKFTRR